MAQLRQASETAKLPYNEAKRQKIPQIIAEKELFHLGRAKVRQIQYRFPLHIGRHIVVCRQPTIFLAYGIPFGTRKRRHDIEHHRPYSEALDLAQGMKNRFARFKRA